MTKTQAKRSSQAWVSEFGPVCCGRIVGLEGKRRPRVDFPGNPNGGPIVARSLDTVRLGGKACSGELPVLLVFEHGDPAKPIIVGVVRSGAASRDESCNSSGQIDSSRHAVIGRRVALEGHEEVTLTSGKASITLTREGRISLCGVEIVSRASGANKIRGASVSIN